MIKAAFFDLDNTLFFTSKFVETARKNSIKSMIRSGLLAEPQEAKDALDLIIRKRGPNYKRHFDILCKKFNGKRFADIISAGIAAYHDTKAKEYIPNKKIIKLLQSLKKRKLKLGIVTTGLKIKQWEKVHRLGLREIMDVVFISDDLQNLSKEIMLINALEKLKLGSHEAMFVGDRIDSDIVSANKIGITSVQILQGKYQNMVLTNEQEKPDYKIKELSELKKIITDINKQTLSKSKRGRFFFF